MATKTVREVLEECFVEARRRGKDFDSTNAAEAEFLEVSPALLSRIKTGTSRLTNAKIKQFAERFAGEDKDYREQIENELVLSREALIEIASQASSPAIKLISEVRELFQHVSNSKSIILIDYRDLPQATEEGEYSMLADEVARAIAGGLKVGMFQPFGTVEDHEADLIKLINEGEPLEARQYLHKLAKEVRKAYREIKEKVKDFASGEGEGQIVLYESEDLLPTVACGISSRIFYVNYLDESTGRRCKQIYQWVAGRDDDDHFIKRDDVSVDADAVGQQFQPVTDFATKVWRLPENNDQLKKAGDHGKGAKWIVPEIPPDE
jgi:hypothetical protein